MADTSERNDSCGTGCFLVASLVFGFVAGVAVGILYAPRRGEETRSRLSKKAKIAEAKAVRVVKKSTQAARQALKNRQQNAEPV